MTFRLVVFVVFVAFLSFSSSLHAATIEDNTLFSFESPRLSPFWLTTGHPSGKSTGATLGLTRRKGEFKDGKQALSFRYPRGLKTLPLLVTTHRLRDFSRIEFWVRPQKAVVWIASIKDKDGAVFSKKVDLKPGIWQKIVLTPADFTCNPESPVKKKRLNPSHVRQGLAFFDLLAVPQLKKKGFHTLFLDNFLIQRSKLRLHRGDLVVKSLRWIRKPLWVQGNVIVRKGAVLRVSSSRFLVTGKVHLSPRSHFFLQGGDWIFQQKHRYEHPIILEKRSHLTLHHGQWWSSHIHQVQAHANSFVSMKHCQMVNHGWTLNLFPKATLKAFDSLRLGEIILYRKSTLKLKKVAGVLLWLRLGATLKKALQLAQTPHLRHWRAHGLQRSIRIDDSRSVLWGLIANPGLKLTLKNSHLRAVGLYFDGTRRATLTHLHNNRLHTHKVLKTGHHQLKLQNTFVRSWNFYTHQQAELTLQNCTFGESISFGRSTLRVQHSTCDGSGGYLGARGQSTTLLEASRVKGLILLHDQSTLYMKNTKHEGRLIASGKSRVFRKKSSSTGKSAPPARR